MWRGNALYVRGEFMYRGTVALDMLVRKKSNSFDFLRGREKTRVSIFHLGTRWKLM